MKSEAVHKWSWYFMNSGYYVDEFYQLRCATWSASVISLLVTTLIAACGGSQ
jgi:hypothetical protein